MSADIARIDKIIDNELKSNIANSILRELSDWFGIEKSIVEYIVGVKK